MNQFLIDGIPYRAVFDQMNERVGCYLVGDSMDLCACEYCLLRKACPADGEDE